MFVLHSVIYIDPSKTERTFFISKKVKPGQALRIPGSCGSQNFKASAYESGYVFCLVDPRTIVRTEG